MRRYYASDWEQSSRDGVVAHLNGGSGCGCSTGCGTGCGCGTDCGCNTGCDCGCNNGCGCDSDCGCPGPVLPPVPPCPGPGPFPPCPGVGPTGPMGPTGTYNKVQLTPKNNAGGVLPIETDFLDDATPQLSAILGSICRIQYG